MASIFEYLEVSRAATLGHPVEIARVEENIATTLRSSPTSTKSDTPLFFPERARSVEIWHVSVPRLLAHVGALFPQHAPKLGLRYGP